MKETCHNDVLKLILCQLQEDIGLDSILVCAIPRNGAPEDSTVYWYSKNKITRAKVDYTNTYEQDDSLILRLTAMVPLTFEFSKDRGIMLPLLTIKLEFISCFGRTLWFHNGW